MAKRRWLKLLLFSFLGIVLVVILVFVNYQRKTQTTGPILCVKSDTGEKMEFSEAKEIALESECVEEGSLTDEYFCNESTGTWWIDLDIQKEGCAPACVIDVSTGEAEINWRCTGLIPSGERIYCKEPRPQICTLECIVNPPYICGSDGQSYCSECQACAKPTIRWHVIQDIPCGVE